MIYAIGKLIFKVYFKVFYKLNITGLENIPKNGATIICANHISFLDPIAIAIITKRKVHYMSKKEIYKNALFSWTLKKLGAFPVDRSITDMTAYKTVISLLKENKIVGIFVQGKRVAGAEEIAAKDGVSLFALKSKATVIPIGIKSTFKRFGTVNVKIGEPLQLENYYDKRINKELCNQVTQIIATNINKLI